MAQLPRKTSPEDISITQNPSALLFAQRLLFQSVPELSSPTLQYIHLSYIDMLDEGEGKKPRFLESSGQPAIFNSDKLTTPIGCSASIATRLTYDVRETAICDDDEKNLGSIEVRRRNKLGEIMLKGHKYERLMRLHGPQILYEEEEQEPYYPKLVAACVTFGLKDLYGFKRRSDYRKLISLVKLSPRLAQAPGNQVA
jgi:hypothetical protein